MARPRRDGGARRSRSTPPSPRWGSRRTGVTGWSAPAPPCRCSSGLAW